MKIIPLLAISLALISCSNMAKNDNRTYTEISCSGIRSWGDCYDQARAMCPNGYDVGKKTEMRESQTRKMEVACKGQ